MPEQDSPAVTHSGCTRYLAEEEGGTYCPRCEIVELVATFRAAAHAFAYAENDDDALDAAQGAVDAGEKLAERLEAGA